MHMLMNRLESTNLDIDYPILDLPMGFACGQYAQFATTNIDEKNTIKDICNMVLKDAFQQHGTKGLEHWAFSYGALVYLHKDSSLSGNPGLIVQP